MAVFSTIGNIIAGDKQSDAIDRSTEISSQNLDKVLNFQRDTRDQNQALFDPFVQSGLNAGNQLNAMLGLGGVQQQETAQPNALSQFQPGRAYGLGDDVVFPAGDSTFRPDFYSYDRAPVNALSGIAPSTTYGANLPSQNGPVAPQTAQQAADDAFDIFRNSTNYQFRLNEGLDAVNSGYAGAGTLQSGAAMRAISDYGQNMASNELANYMNLLANQQAVGAGAASSVAGVNQNFANQATNATNLNSTNAANAALASGQAAANTWSGIGNALGSGAGALYGILG